MHSFVAVVISFTTFYVDVLFHVSPQIAFQLACFHTWRQQCVREDLALLLKARQLLISEGDVPFIGYCTMHFASRSLFSSGNLTAALGSRLADLALVKTTQAPDMIRYLEGNLYSLSELAGCVTFLPCV